MSTEVAICNLAISRLGQQAKITSISPPDASAHAARCAVMYPFARNVTLERFDWPFASTRVALASATPDIESDQFPYAFALPSDCLRPIALLPEGATDEDENALEFIREGDILLTSVDSVVLRYTRLVTDTSKFSPSFESSLAWQLAGQVAGAITEDKSVIAWCNDMFEMEISRAATSAAAGIQRKHNFTPSGVACR